MILARVKGNVVATASHPCFRGHRILIVQPVNELGKDIGSSFLSCDSVQAAPGDTVLVKEGTYLASNDRGDNPPLRITTSGTRAEHAVHLQHQLLAQTGELSLRVLLEALLRDTPFLDLISEHRQRRFVQRQRLLLSSLGKRDKPLPTSQDTLLP